MKKPDIQIPDTMKGNHIVCVRGVWFACYTVDGKQVRKSLKTPHFADALIARDEFFESLKAPVKAAKTPAEKVALDNKKYIYSRPRFSVVVGKKHLGFFSKRKDAEIARDQYIAQLLQ